MSDATILVRPAVAGDAEAVAGLASELRAHLGDPLHHLTPAVIRRDGFGPDAQFELLVAEVAGAVVGYAIFYEVYEPAYAARGFYMADLCVGAGMRRRGIGRRLIDGLSEAARRRGRTFIWWHTRPDNAEALAFYQGLGLDFIEPFVVHVRILPPG